MSMSQSPVEFELSLARTKNNEPLTDRQKALLRDIIAQPTLDLWRAAFTICLSCPKAGKPIILWHAVNAVDPTFQRMAGPRDQAGKTTWDRVPTSDILAAAVRWATH